MLLDFLRLFYPRPCLVCNEALIRGEDFICTRCQYQLPKFSFYYKGESPLSKIFWGRIPLENTYAQYLFEKGNNVQKVLYELKYRGQKGVARLIGQWAGEEILSRQFAPKIDLVVPIPLHIKKQRIRGYNQSEYFAKGLADQLKLGVNSTDLVRSRKTRTQTKKGRYARWKNAANTFVIKSEKAFENKHILLVDDVITTGATIESAGQALLAIRGTRLSIASIAFACA